MLFRFLRRRKSLNQKQQDLERREQDLKEKESLLGRWETQLRQTDANNEAKFKAERAKIDAERQRLLTDVTDQARQQTEVRFDFARFQAVSIERVDHGTEKERTMIGFAKNFKGGKEDKDKFHPEYFVCWCSRAQHAQLVKEYDEYRDSLKLIKKKA